MRRFRLFLIFCFPLLIGCGGGSTAAPTVPARKIVPENRAVAPARPFIGMNLSSVIDWSGEWPFVNAFKTSRPWTEHGKGPFTYDDRGNPMLRPGQWVETLLFRGLGGHYPAGKYVATYQGTGEVEITQFDVDAVVAKQPGRIEFRVKPGNDGLAVRIKASAPRDPIRDIRVQMSECDSATPFQPQFLERLKPFPVIRFMDWQRTNNSPVAIWSQRARPDDARYSTDVGVPPEVMIELANRLGANPWFCVPHRADDDYVRLFAKLIKERLDPSLTVYVEYSNEVWNWGFGQTGYALEEGRKRQLDAPEQLHFYAKRSVEVFKLFEKEFGGRDRLVRVLAGQFANPADCERMLTFRSAHQHADAFAVGAYFGYELGAPANAAATAKLTVDEVLKRAEAEIDGPFRDTLRRQAFLARKYNLRLLAYEGGQHLVGHGGTEKNQPLTDLFIAANRHPRMADLYRKQLNHWFAEGGGAFVAFAFAGQPSQWGSWGVLEYQDQPVESAPKYRTLAELARELPR